MKGDKVKDDGGAGVGKLSAEGVGDIFKILKFIFIKKIITSWYILFCTVHIHMFLYVVYVHV